MNYIGMKQGVTLHVNTPKHWNTYQTEVMKWASV